MRKTKDLLLVYKDSSLKVEGYTDLSFLSDIDDSKSNSGYVYTLNRGVVWWKSSKQDTTTNSTTKVKYITTIKAAKEGVWMKKFITDLGVMPSNKEQIPLYCNNNGAIAQTKELKSHQ